ISLTFLEDRTMIPATSQRVPLHTRESLNERIRREAELRVERYRHAPPEEIDRRLAELDREWDIERALEANAATVSLAGLALGAFVNRKFFAAPAAVSCFLLLHAIQGWCQPVSGYRRLGFRTEREIDEERQALKIIRGDYRP